MSYLLHSLIILLGCFMIGNASIEIVDHYRKTHPFVTNMTYGDEVTPKMFVKGILSVENQSGGKVSAIIDWSGDIINFKPLPTGEKKP